MVTIYIRCNSELQRKFIWNIPSHFSFCINNHIYCEKPNEGENNLTIIIEY